jgi:hypothetical protein
MSWWCHRASFFYCPVARQFFDRTTLGWQKDLCFLSLTKRKTFAFCPVSRGWFNCRPYHSVVFQICCWLLYDYLCDLFGKTHRTFIAGKWSGKKHSRISIFSGLKARGPRHVFWVPCLQSRSFLCFDKRGAALLLTDQGHINWSHANFPQIRAEMTLECPPQIP